MLFKKAPFFLVSARGKTGKSHSLFKQLCRCFKWASMLAFPRGSSATYPSCFSQDSMEYVVSSSRALQTSIGFLPGSTPGPLLRIISRSLYLGHVIHILNIPLFLNKKTNPNCKMEQFLKNSRVSLSSQGREWVRAWMLLVVQLNLDIFFSRISMCLFWWEIPRVTIERSQAKCANCAKKSFFLLRKRQSQQLLTSSSGTLLLVRFHCYWLLYSIVLPL